MCDVQKLGKGGFQEDSLFIVDVIIHYYLIFKLSSFFVFL